MLLALPPHLVMAAHGDKQDSSASSAETAGPVTIRHSGNNIILSNDYLERTLTTEGGRLRTADFTNKLSHQTYALSGREFQIELIDDEMRAVNPVILTTQDFTVVDRKIDEEPDGGRKITFYAEPVQRKSANVSVAISYELKPGDYYTRQWIKVKSMDKVRSNEKVLFIHYLVVFKDSWNPVIGFDLGGLGQPLFGRDLFMGLEYPSGFNEANGNEVSLGSYVGLEIPKEGVASASAVLGVTSPRRVHDAFMMYIDRIRAAPSRPYIGYNNFYDVPGTKMNTQNTLERAAELQAHLLKPYSLHLDSFTLDDSWDDPEHLWAIDEKRFPNGFRDSVNALAGIDSHLGLWLSPMGGYGPEKDVPLVDRRDRVAAGEKAGLETNSNATTFCMGETYRQYLKHIIVGMISKYGANYFKFDGIPLACNQRDDEHPGGIYSRETAVRNLIALTRDIRSVNPHVFIDLATGPWLSPWWLAYGDSVDYGGEDYAHDETIPSPTPRQSAISYRDSVAYQNLNVARAQFPVSSLSSTGIIKDRDLLRGKEESLDDWKDEAVNYIGAGIMFADIMLSPTGSSKALLKPEEWDALGQTLQYMVRNGHPLVDNAKLVLGDPARGEPYGYVHYSRKKSIILLRNPSVRPASISLALNEENGIEPTQAQLWADIIYPFRLSLPGTLTYGSTIELTLDGYEQRVLELVPVREGVSRIAGIRFSLRPSKDSNVTYTVYSAEGSEPLVHLANSVPYSEVRVDGKKGTLQAIGTKSYRQMVVPFGRRAARESQPNCQKFPIPNGGKPRSVQFLDISLSCLIPSDFQRSEIVLLLESANSFGDIEADVVLDHKTVPASVERSKMWHWSAVTLMPGRHSVEFKLRFKSGVPSSIHASGWLRARRLLAAKQLRLILQPGTTFRPLDEDLLPCSSQLERKTYLLFDRRIH